MSRQNPANATPAANQPAASQPAANAAAEGKIRRRALVLMLATTLLWGTSFYPTKLVLERLSEGEYLLLRFLLTTLIFGALAWRQIAAACRATALSGAFAGLFLGAAFFAQTLGFSGTASATVAFLTSTTVIFVPLLCWLLFGQPPRARAIIGALLALCGLYFLSGAAIFSLARGELLSLLCALFFAAHIVACERALSRCELRAFVFFQFVSATAVIAACAIATGTRLEIARLDAITVGFCLYGAVFLTVFAFFAQNYAQRHLSGAKVAVLLALEPLSAGVLGAFMGESFGAMGILGAALIIAGVVFS